MFYDFLDNLSKIFHKLGTHGHRSLVVRLHCEFATELVDALVAFLLHPGIEAFVELSEGIDAVVARMNLQFKTPLRCDDEFISRLWLEKQGIKYIFHQDIFRASDETLCFRGDITLVCLINGRLSDSEDYNQAFAPYL